MNALASCQPTFDARDARDSLRRFAGARVLLAKDSRRLSQLMSAQINQWRLRTVTTGDGLDACRLALSAWRDGNPFNVLLLDESLPGMTGRAITHELRQAGYPGSIILLTTHASPGHAADHHWLPMPLGPQQLAQCLADALATPSS